MKKETQRFLLYYYDPLELDQQSERVLGEVSKKTYLTKKKLGGVISKLSKLGWEYEEFDRWWVAGVLSSPDGGRVFILKVGRTVREVVSDMWAWLKRHKDKKLRLEISSGDEVKEEALRLFHVEREQCGSFIVRPKRLQKEKLVELIERFVSGYAPIEHEVYVQRDNYRMGWGLHEEEKSLLIWEETRNRGWGGKGYIKIKLSEDELEVAEDEEN